MEGPSTTAAVVTTAVVTVSLLFCARSLLVPSRKAVLASPLRRVEALGTDQLSRLEYRPDHFPGARDVSTPYGTMRVYEFGPEKGRKVLLVHGISTSCMTLTHIADGLVARGCRVMLFDLFGRGFSDGVGDLPHDARLYTAQMLCALASSPLPWTGAGALSVVGYSLGGGLAVHFTNAFPDLVASLVLLAPAGLIRAANFGVVTKFIFQSGWVPEPLLAVLTARRLQQPIAASRVKRLVAEADAAAPQTQTSLPSALEKVASGEVLPRPDSFVDLAAAEVADPVPEAASSADELAPLERRVMEYVRWMVRHHDGFVPAFMSCIRFAPMTEQHDAWRALARRSRGSTAVLLARSDEIIEPADYEADALPLMGGEEHVLWRVLPGGHDFVMTHPREILAAIDEFWCLK